MKAFPSVKSNICTVALYGFPNVGKTTLITKLTDSKPEINSYAFTTKTLNIGYFKIGNSKVQLIDTPGALGRKNKTNPIEKQAELALKYCCDAIVFVFDLTGEYSIEMQKELLFKIEERFSHSKKIVVYVSKLDIVDKEKISSFDIGKKYIDNLDDLRKELSRMNLEYHRIHK
jgi:nucleolar GTP-binding protein